MKLLKRLAVLKQDHFEFDDFDVMTTVLYGHKRLYDIIKENPYISTKDISETIGNITADGVRYHINKLKKLGVLERVGADKGGYWKIKS